MHRKNAARDITPVSGYVVLGIFGGTCQTPMGFPRRQAYLVLGFSSLVNRESVELKWS
jgi:hypothetical protein